MSDDRHPETVDRLMHRVRKSHAAIRKHREAMAALAAQARADSDNDNNGEVTNS